MPLILASASPRRRELLAAAGFVFEVVAPRKWAECGVCSGESPPDLVARLAYQKAAEVSTRVGPATIVACDTVAVCRGQILGKPADEAHARQMLEAFAGQPHQVYSGLCVWRVPEGQPLVNVDETALRMDRISPAQIEDYLASGLWEGKAGAFGFQDRPGWLHIERGSESNVVGLPMELLQRMLAETGWQGQELAGAP
jgi:nucleoside triphosphate pyrophosphatase